MSRGKSIEMLFVMAVAVVFLFSFSASAAEYDYGDGRILYVNGYLETMVGHGSNDETYFDDPAGGYMKSGNPNGVNQVLITGYVETQLKLGRDFEFRTAWRMQGDQVDDFRESEHWKNYYGMANDNINFDDDIDEIIREFNVAYFSEYFSCRIGKQQLVWGETDGIRIMDQISPLDLRRGFIFYDSDFGFGNSRVPLWMLKTELNTAMDFEAGGFSDFGLELTWIPDVDPFNRFEIGPREGGTYAYPVPAGFGGLKQLNVTRDKPSRTIDNSSFGARLKFNYKGALMTLNYFYGWSADGYLAPDSNQGPVPGPLGPMYGINLYNGIGNVADGAGISFDATLKTYRQKTTGFTLARQLVFLRPFMKLMNQFDTPILRIEALYQFDKKYNTSNPMFDAMGLSPAFNLPAEGPAGDYVDESDEIRWMVGLDWFALRIPWINSKNKVTLSSQFINFHIMDHEKNMYQGPYDWFLKEDFIAWSLLVGSSYWKEKIRPQIMYVRDTTYNSFLIKPTVQVDLGDSWRTEVGAYLVDGNNEEKQFGLYDNRDSVYLKIKYQF